MKSAGERSFRFVMALIISVGFFAFGSFALAQDEMLEGDAVPVLLNSPAETSSSTGSSTNLTPSLQEFSKQHADDMVPPEKPKLLSFESVSVEVIKDISVQLAVFGFLLLLLLVMIAFMARSERAKKYIFTTMVLLIVVPSLYFISSTIFVNFISETKGPVHWHTDFRIFACGEELDPPEPEGKLSNKTGTPEIHQHEDKRLHVEGVLIEIADSSFQNFVRVQGGELTRETFKVPTGDGFKTFTNGDTCPDGKPGEWNVFKYSVNTETNEVTKEKLDDFVNYTPAPHINVPPGDCLIFEFGPRKNDTEYICNFYQLAINDGDITPTWTQ